MEFLTLGVLVGDSALTVLCFPPFVGCMSSAEREGGREQIIFECMP